MNHSHASARLPAIFVILGAFCSLSSTVQPAAAACVAMDAESDKPDVGRTCAAILNDPASTQDARVQALLMRGLWHMRAQRDNAAKADFDAGLKLAPEHAKLLQLRAQLHLYENELDAALALAQKSASIDPERATTFSTLGRIALVTGDKRSALAYYNRAVELAPNNPFFKYERAEILISLSRAIEAFADTGWLIAQPADVVNGAGQASMDGHNVKLHLASRIQHGNVLKAMDRFEEAEQHFNKIVADERTAFTLTQRSQFLHSLPVGAGMQSRLNEALADAEQAVRLDPKDSRAHRQYAATLEYARRPAEALTAVDAALRLERHENGLAPLMWSRARLLRALGRKEDAVQAARGSLLAAQAYDPGYLMRRVQRLERLGYWIQPTATADADQALITALTACMEDEKCW